MRIKLLLLSCTFPPLLFAADSFTDTSIVIFQHPKHEHSFSVSAKLPMGSFGEDYTYTHSNDDAVTLSRSIEGDAGGMGANIGFELSFSGYYYFNKKKVQTVGGLKVTYLSFGSIPFEWKKSGYVFDGAEFSNFRFLSIKIGPAMRIIAHKNASVHLYSQMILTRCWNASWKNNLSDVYYDASNNRYSSSDNSEFKMNSGNGLRNETGLSVRLARVLLEVSYSFGKVKFNNVHFERNIAVGVEEYHSSTQTYTYYASGSDQTTTSLTAKMPTAMLRFSVGYIFGK